MSTTNTMRSQDEIRARVDDLKNSPGDDFFGFRREILIGALDYERARDMLKKSVTREAWDADRFVTVEDVVKYAKKYLEFAVGKALDHRGISAGRSTDKLGEIAWLLGRDDVFEAMKSAEHAQYGAPKLKAFAEGMGFDWPDDPELARMADGEPCTDDCCEGCER